MRLLLAVLDKLRRLEERAEGGDPLAFQALRLAAIAGANSLSNLCSIPAVVPIAVQIASRVNAWPVLYAHTKSHSSGIRKRMRKIKLGTTLAGKAVATIPAEQQVLARAFHLYIWLVRSRAIEPDTPEWGRVLRKLPPFSKAKEEWFRQAKELQRKCWPKMFEFDWSLSRLEGVDGKAVTSRMRAASGDSHLRADWWYDRFKTVFMAIGPQFETPSAHPLEIL